MLNCKQQGLPNMFLISKSHITNCCDIICHSPQPPAESPLPAEPAPPYWLPWWNKTIREPVRKDASNFHQAQKFGFFLVVKKALLWLFEILQFCLIYRANNRRCHWRVCTHTYTHIDIDGTCILEPCCSNCWGTVILLLY